MSRQRPVTDSEGRRLLRAMLRHVRLVDLARELSETPANVSRWASGKRVPMGWHERVALERVGIPAPTWDERANYDAAARAAVEAASFRLATTDAVRGDPCAE